jgi:hypothetical protein
MTLHPLAGVYAAALTPLKADSTPDLEPVPAFLAFLAERGAVTARSCSGRPVKVPRFRLKNAKLYGARPWRFASLIRVSAYWPEPGPPACKRPST